MMKFKLLKKIIFVRIVIFDPKFTVTPIFQYYSVRVSNSQEGQCSAPENKMSLIREEPDDSMNQYFLKDRSIKPAQGTRS